MRTTLQYNDQTIEITTEHAASSYGLPVVLVNDALTDLTVDYEADPPDKLTPLGTRYAETIGHYPQTMLALNDQYGNIANAILDAIIAQFETARKARNTKETKR